MKRDLAFGRPFAVLVGSMMLLSVLAYNFLKSKKKSTRRAADDLGEPSSSTTSTESNNYDVFLNFCGKDTRQTFVDHLYLGLRRAGICVFKDDVDLRKGEKISTSLGHAIKNSKISIPILSRYYGERMYCLQELVQMMERKKSDGHLVLPIFYGVGAAHVRHQIGDFGATFSKFGEKYPGDVDKWRKALGEVGSLLGWEAGKAADRPEGELIREVVEKVLSELKRFQTDLTKKFVGIDDAVDDILRLLDSNPSATQIVGIHGMGGIGKTTVANAVYSRLSNQFRYHSVLEDIRGSLSDKEGKLRLQKRLISDLLTPPPQVTNSLDAMSTMESRFELKKALINLDGVEHRNNLDDLFQKKWFATGSKIIVTTRDHSVLDYVEVDHKYKLERISAEESLTMFSRHAFRMDCPPPGFETLACDVVATAEGLPLALKVIGLSLYRKEKKHWEWLLEELKNYPCQDVGNLLKISYEALSQHQKEIFLDIACFLIGTDSRIAHYMWKSRGFIPEKEIDILSSMSLIEIEDNHELKMHGQLRDLGRKIAGEGAPMQQRRLWVYDKALEVLQDNKENKNIEALLLDKGGSSKFMEQKGFKILPKLNFLQVSEVEFTGDFKDSLPELRWLKWERCPKSFTATNVHLEKLLILDLSGGFISDIWEGWSSIKMEGLKVLNLSGCSDLKSTPDLSSFKRLERLVLENCENLEKFHPSIRYVERLVSLNLRRCGSLKVLPAEVGELKELKELVVDKTNIQEILPCMESLRKLEMLSAVGCRRLTRVGSSMSGLVSLSSLNLSNCKKLRALPDSLVALGELQRLSLARCYLLEQIPPSIGKLGKLVELDLSSTGIKELPPSIGELNKLETLRVSNSEIETLPRAIGRLRSLQELDASGCHQLKGEILLDKGGLSHLSTLRLGSAKISRLPESSREEASTLELHELSALQNLDLLYCSELQSLPEPPSRLSSLQLTCRSHELRPLSHLSHLTKLTLHTCMSLQIIPELPSCIRKLRVCKCPKLERLSVLPDSLLELELLQCYGLGDLDGLEALTSLRKLDVSTSAELSNLENFEDLESLRCSDIQSYDEKADHLHAIGGLHGLKTLKVLNISGRKHIRQLDLSQSEQLKQLIVNNCESLDKIDFHTSIKSLERFDTDGCKPQIPDSLARDRT